MRIARNAVASIHQNSKKIAKKWSENFNFSQRRFAFSRICRSCARHYIYHIIRITIRTKRYISFCILLYCIIRARGLFSLGFVSRFCFRNEFTTRLITDHSRWHYKYLFILRNVFAVCRRPRTRPRDIIARVWCTRGIIYKFAAHNPLGRVARIPPGVGDEGMRN